MRVAWATDIHLDHADPGAMDTFRRELRAARPDALVVTGDIAEASTFAPALVGLAKGLPCPVHFVLGNHDCYGSSIAAVRDAARDLHEREAGCVWLPRAGVVSLTERTALIGHGGWADGRLGNYADSLVMLNDYVLIEEFAKLFAGQRPTAGVLFDEVVCERRLALMKRLGDEAAEYLGRTLREAIETHERVVLATHVPPFRETCRHRGKISDDDWLPHFSHPAMSRASARRFRPCMTEMAWSVTGSPAEARGEESWSLVRTSPRLEEDPLESQERHLEVVRGADLLQRSRAGSRYPVVTRTTSAAAVSPAAQPVNSPFPPPSSTSSSISSMIPRRPVGAWGWPHTSEQP